MDIKRGDIFLINLNPTRGSEQKGVRPCLVIQNDYGNRYSPLIIVAPLTSKEFPREFSTNVFISKEDSGLDKNSTVLLNQIKAIDKRRIIKKLSSLDFYYMSKIEIALKISLGIN